PTTNQLLLVPARFPVLTLPPGGMNVIDVREAALAHVRALWLGQPGSRYLLGGPHMTYIELANIVKRIIGSQVRLRPLRAWTLLPGSLFCALLSGILPQVPNPLSVPNYRNGFIRFHLTGALADRTFDLVHRPVSVTIWDTLRWFQEAGLAPWLTQTLIRPD